MTAAWKAVIDGRVNGPLGGVECNGITRDTHTEEIPLGLKVKLKVLLSSKAIVQTSQSRAWPVTFFGGKMIFLLNFLKSLFSRKLKVKVKKIHPKAVIPKYAKFGDAGMDLVATSKWYDKKLEKVAFGFGLAFEIPYGYVGLLFPRSTNRKTKLLLSNAVGVLDHGFRGEVTAYFTPIERPTKNYEVGDRVVQMVIMPFPEIEMVETSELPESERGTGGYGSTGA